MKKTVAVLIVLVMVFSLSGCCLKHEWKDATCTEPKTCTKCGKTEGEPTGHLHTEWKEEKVDVIKAKRDLVLVCEDCGKEIDDKTEDLDSFIDGDVFLFTAREFVERIQMFYDEINGENVPLTFKYSINNYGSVNFDVYNRYDSWLAWGIFYDTEGHSLKEDNQDGGINCVAIFVPEQDGIPLDTAHYLLTLLTNAACRAADPQVTDFEVYSDPIMNNNYATGNGELHGLTYSFGLSDDNEFSLYLEIPD